MPARPSVPGTATPKTTLSSTCGAAVNATGEPLADLAVRLKGYGAQSGWYHTQWHLPSRPGPLEALVT
jgi:hypothetical protein